MEMWLKFFFNRLTVERLFANVVSQLLDDLLCLTAGELAKEQAQTPSPSN